MHPESRLHGAWLATRRHWLLAAVLALGLLASCVGCASLPELHEQAQAAPVATPQMRGAHGVLPQAQRAAILARLKRERGDIDILERHVALEGALVGSPLVLGNRTTLLLDGPDTYAAMFKALEGARDHINLEVYIFEDDEMGRRFVDLLLAKQAEGVQVNILYDSIGSLGTPAAFFDTLRQAGVRVLEFNPVNPLKVRKEWLLNNRDHRKLLIVDGQTAFLGGVNISHVYSSGSSFSRSRPKPAADGKPVTPWRDTHLQIDGPVVAEFQKAFLDTWQRQHGEPLPARNYFPGSPPRGNDLVRAVGSRAADDHSLLYAALISAIVSAERRVYVTNAYFVPDPQLVQALQDAARRGVDVRLILPGKTDSWITYHAGRSHYAELLEAGVKIYERRHALLHAKTVMIDGVWSSVGSTNLDWRSFLHNDELDAIVLGAGFADRLKAAFLRDQAESQRIGAEEWADRSPMLRIKEWSARLLEYWL
ncbi:cardiolipin synthase [Chitinimonas koreensis]|uniref:cardiolipin synthase n=1 Tax=Chitinimonas koreensis TaxID=356302 RepID=UPI00041AD2E9|nr:cardiolipin synthase [Chitinimonas koreensis]QNM95160.1 cardiolipin synthase [Chitinimonas koreensis]